MARKYSPQSRNPARRKPRFDPQALRRIAGVKVFERGVEYHDDGSVEIVTIEPNRVLAEVQGTELYRTKLTGAGDKITGDCTCPAASDWGFCKHMVATALAVNALDPDTLAAQEGSLGRLRAHLQGKGKEALVAIVMRAAERDPALRRDLELAAASEDDDEARLRVRFEKALADAMRIRDFIDYSEAEGWAQGVEKVLDRIEELIGRGHAALVQTLIEGFFARLGSALEQIDDSGGQGSALAERAGAIHLAACRVAEPDPLALARDLFARETESLWGFFVGASNNYAEVLGARGLAEYRRLAEQAWDEIPSRRAGDRRTAEHDGYRRQLLESILDGFAERAGDLDRRVALRAKDLSTPYRYIEIAELLSTHGRAADALKWAEEGLWLFEAAPDERLAICAATLHQRLGYADAAERLLWQCFERRPSRDLHARLLTAAGKDQKAAEAVTDKAVALLEARLAARRGKEQAGWWGSPADPLIEILTAAKRLGPAWDAVRRHGCSAHLLEALAKASERDHPAEALAGYGRLVEQAIASTNQQGYEAAWRLLERMRLLRTRSSDTEAHAAHLTELAQRYKAKRNFIKLLQSRGGVTVDSKRPTR